MAVSLDIRPASPPHSVALPAAAAAGSNGTETIDLCSSRSFSESLRIENSVSMYKHYLVDGDGECAGKLPYPVLLKDSVADTRAGEETVLITDAAASLSASNHHQTIESTDHHSHNQAQGSPARAVILRQRQVKQSSQKCDPSCADSGSVSSSPSTSLMCDSSTVGGLDPNAQEFTPAARLYNEQPNSMNPSRIYDDGDNHHLDVFSRRNVQAMHQLEPSSSITLDEGCLRIGVCEGGVEMPQMISCGAPFHGYGVLDPPPPPPPPLIPYMAPPLALLPVCHPQEFPPYVGPLSSSPEAMAPTKIKVSRRFGGKEAVSRAVIMSGVPCHLSEGQLREELEKKWGAVRSLGCERQSMGMVSVLFFDLRAAKKAVAEMQGQHLVQQRCAAEAQKTEEGAMVGGDGLLCGAVVWAEYIPAWLIPVADAHNQGTLVLFNVGPDISMRELRLSFEKFGDVREMRETPLNKQHKFVEFYDIRDAEAAWSGLNGTEVCGKELKIEFSRQGRRLGAAAMGWKRRTATPRIGAHRQDVAYIGSSPFVASPAQSSDSSEAHGWIGEAAILRGWQGFSKLDLGFHQQHMWSSLSFDYQASTAISMSLCPSDPGLDHIIHDQRHGMVRDEPRPHQSSLYNRYGIAIGDGSGTWYSGEITGPRRLRNGRSMTIREQESGRQLESKSSENGDDGMGCPSHGSERKTEVGKHSNGRGAHLHFQFDEREVLMSSGNARTTLIIRNIPNKYSQHMLLTLLDKHCLECNRRIADINEPESAYDFVYLPIDFKNRCNLGYGFVNFTTALATLKFYRSFHEQTWEEFNSRKICKIAYARVQGRAALEEHFRNSRFVCDTDEYLPLVFVPPRNGIEFPAPRVAVGQLRMMKSSSYSISGGQCSIATYTPVPPDNNGGPSSNKNPSNNDSDGSSSNALAAIKA